MIEEHCPRGKVQKLGQELWSLTMKGSDIVTYTARFNDLVALCPGMVPTEGKKIEWYIWGLVPPFQGECLSFKSHYLRQCQATDTATHRLWNPHPNYDNNHNHPKTL